VANPKGKDEFDFLTFFIYVMLLLTVIVGGFAALNQRKVSDVTKQIKREIYNLEQMQEVALDEDFRTWVVKDREGSASTTSRGTADFQGLYIKLARHPEHRLVLENHTLEGSIPHPGGVELPFRLIIKRCRLEEVVKFLVKLEEAWPGARVKKFDKLSWEEKGEEKGWDVTVVVSIFKADP
jgi:hypothetical protein